MILSSIVSSNLILFKNSIQDFIQEWLYSNTRIDVPVTFFPQQSSIALHSFVFLRSLCVNNILQRRDQLIMEASPFVTSLHRLHIHTLILIHIDGCKYTYRWSGSNTHVRLRHLLSRFSMFRFILTLSKYSCTVFSILPSLMFYLSTNQHSHLSHVICLCC